MLAHFSLLGVFFSLLAGSWTFFALFWFMLVVFFELWAAPASILGRPGQVSEPSKPHLTMFFGVRTRVSQKCSSCNKTTVFAMFYRLRNMPHTATEHVFCIACKAFLDMVYGLLQQNPCWHSLAAFHNHPAARRYVRSTWNWSQVGLKLNQIWQKVPPGDLKLMSKKR